MSGELSSAVQAFPGLVPQFDELGIVFHLAWSISIVHILTKPLFQYHRCNLVTDNGDVYRLAKLTGTIPICYKQQVYYIPIEVWMPTAFPEAPPTCYVRPAAGMQVPDGHPFVTRDGLCHLGIVTLSSFESHCCVVWFLARVANVCWSVRDPSRIVAWIRTRWYMGSSAALDGLAAISVNLLGTSTSL